MSGKANLNGEINSQTCDACKTSWSELIKNTLSFFLPYTYLHCPISMDQEHQNRNVFLKTHITLDSYIFYLLKKEVKNHGNLTVL